MNKGLIGAICFLAGGAAGFYAGKLYFEKKGAAQVQAQLDELHAERSELAKKNANKPDLDELYADSKARLQMLRDSAELAERLNYKVEEESDDDDIPAAPEQFLEINAEEYARVNGLQHETLTWYRDHVLADEEDEIVDVEESVGVDAVRRVESLGEEEAVYIRNLRTGVDYELLYNLSTYTSVTGRFYSESRE